LANSVPSKRSFSANGHIHTLQRNRLSEERVDQQTFVYVYARVFTRIHNTSSRKKLWVDLHEKEWLELEDSYLDLFRDAHGRQQNIEPGDEWYGVKRKVQETDSEQEKAIARSKAAISRATKRNKKAEMVY